MLVLTRTPGQKILIGEGISIAVLSVNGKQTRLGIEAPKDIPVDREEIAKRKRSQDEQQPDPPT